MKVKQKKPNFIIFITDQQRADHVGCMGNPALWTPHIDSIAKAGATFTSCYTSCPACAPARATLFTGLTNRANGMRQNGNPLPKTVPTLPGELQKAGYRTHAVGKIHINQNGCPIGTKAEDYNDIHDNPERRGHWLQGKIKKFPDNYYGLETADFMNGHGDYVYGDYTTWLNKHYPGMYDRYQEWHTDNKKPDGWEKIYFFPSWDLSIPEDLHYNKWVADKSIDFLNQQKESEKPFFLWCSFPDPHAPIAAIKRWADFYRDRTFPLPPPVENLDLSTIPDTIIKLVGGEEAFRKKALHDAGGGNLRELFIQTYAMISHVDEQIGRILAALRQYELDGDTILTFTSDHGDQLGEHGLMHKNFWPYDGCNRVPFIFSVPGNNQQGFTVDQPVSLLDFMPTILDFAGVEQPDADSNPEYRRHAAPLSSPLPGESLKPAILTGTAPSRSNALVEFDDDLNNAFDLLQMRMLVTEQYKLCFYSPTREGVLFDRKNDPLEINNLFYKDEYKQILNELFSGMVNEINRTESRFPRRMAGA